MVLQPASMHYAYACIWCVGVGISHLQETTHRRFDALPRALRDLKCLHDELCSEDVVEAKNITTGEIGVPRQK